MKYMLILSLFFTIAGPGALGQSAASHEKSAKEVVEEFWKLETQGARLTTQGWRKTGIFFVRPGLPLEKRTIGVISGKYGYSIDERWVKGNHAEIANGCVDLGRIDNDLRYTPPDPRYDKTAILYHLVLSEKHWEFGPDGVTEREVTGPVAWRIENAEPILWLTVDTAIRYVKERRSETTNPVVKKSADATLARLLKLK